MNEYDPYPDLPPIPPELRIDPDDLTPDALTPVTTPDQATAVVTAIEVVVSTQIGHRGQRVVDEVVNEVWVDMWQRISEALSNPEQFLSDYRNKES